MASLIQTDCARCDASNSVTFGGSFLSVSDDLLMTVTQLQRRGHCANCGAEPELPSPVWDEAIAAQRQVTNTP